MSHHLDSPLARQDIRLDITDLYCFRGETGTVFVINVCHTRFVADKLVVNWNQLVFPGTTPSTANEKL